MHIGPKSAILAVEAGRRLGSPWSSWNFGTPPRCSPCGTLWTGPRLRVARSVGHGTAWTVHPYPPPLCPGTGNVRPRNQGLVLAHDRGQPRTAEKNFSGALRRGMRTLSFPTLNHIDK